MTATFPSVPEQLSAEWLTDVLRGGGHLGLDRRVARFEVTPVGAGILCILVRLHLTYTAGPSGDGPATIVAKFAHPVEANRQIGINTRMYEREASFFNDIAGLVDVPKPTCYFADVVAETGETVVLLEDLGDYRPGDQVAGVTVDEVRDIIEAIVRLHAAFWDRTDVGLLHDTMRIDTSYVEPFLIGMDATWERGAREFAADIAPDVVPHLHRYAAQMRPLMRRMGAFPQTVVHGDARVDNVMFADRPGHHPVMLIDWQAVMVSNPLHDLAYLISQSLDVEPRRANEAELVEQYHRALCRLGVTGFTLERCWEAYDIAVLMLFSCTLIIAGISQPEDAQSVALGAAVLRRASWTVSDRNLMALLDPTD